MKINPFNEGDKIIPSVTSPLIGSNAMTSTYKVHRVLDHESIMVIRDGWHKFQSMNCYFELKNPL